LPGCGLRSGLSGRSTSELTRQAQDFRSRTTPGAAVSAAHTQGPSGPDPSLEGLRSVATPWQHPYRPCCPMCPESGRYGRFGRHWTYLHFSYKVEGLVDLLVRGGSSPLERIASFRGPSSGTRSTPCDRHSRDVRATPTRRTAGAHEAALPRLHKKSLSGEGRPPYLLDRVQLCKCRRTMCIMNLLGGASLLA
jgi:hypothetical protein